MKADRGSRADRRHAGAKVTRTAISFGFGIALIIGLAGAASAVIPEGELPPAPSISSDKPDYAPGEEVVLAGEHWLAGEAVHIRVNDDAGETWRRDVDVTADAEGVITDTFNLPEWFVAEYHVTATGAVSGTATTSFTDGNVKVRSAISGLTFGYARSKFSNTTCTGSPSSGPAADTADFNGDTVGVGNTESLLIVANTNANAPNASRVFVSWSNPDGLSISPGLTSASICVGGFSSGTKDLIANYDALPTLTRTNASVTVNEGTTAANTGTWGDADASNTVTLSSSVGTVVKAGTNAAGTWSWTYPTTDGSAQSQSVTITANDGVGGVTSVTFALTVSNVAPTATFNAPPSAAEGSPINLSLTGSSDVSSVDSGVGFTYAFDCGSGYGAFGASNSTSCSTTDNGSRSVKAKIRDKDLGVTEYTATVTINNVAPTATFNAPASVDEGDDIELSLTSVIDPGDDTFEYRFKCGAADWGDWDTANTASCPTTDDGTVVVKGQVRDEDGGSSEEYSASVTVNNVAPTATGLTASAAAACGTQNAVTLSFSDPALTSDTYSASINWGDGNTSSPANIASGQVFGHVYAAAGVYTVTVSVSDEDGGTSTSSSVFVTTNYTIEGGRILQPVNDTRNGHELPSVFKYGSTIPVKIRVRDCNGTIATNLAPSVKVQKVANGSPTAGEEVPYSTSAADTGNLMRLSGDMYIYNLNSKSFSSDPTSQWRIIVRIPSTLQDVWTDIGLRK